jgi:hypothetical protein
LRTDIAAFVLSKARGDFGQLAAQRVGHWAGDCVSDDAARVAAELAG